MKRYNNLFPRIIDKENIALAHTNAQKGKKHYPAVIRVNNNPEWYLERLHSLMANKEYATSTYYKFLKRGPNKDRWIYKLPYFPDRIAHHCIVQVLEPIWSRVFIRDTYSALKGRGIHDGVRRMKSFLLDRKNAMYCLKMDVHKFYPSIDNAIMKQILALKIKCRDTMWFLSEIIDSGRGLPIGNYLSQYFGNLYLAYFDHWVKEVLQCRMYSRYCDDIVLLHYSKKWLHEARKRISGYLHDRLKLHLKPNWRVFPTFQSGLDYLGYVFLDTHVRVRKDIVKRFKTKVKGIKENYKHMPVTKIVNTLMSYYGWLKQANAYNLWSTYVDDKIRSIVSYVCYVNKIKNPLRGIAW